MSARLRFFLFCLLSCLMLSGVTLAPASAAAPATPRATSPAAVQVQASCFQPPTNRDLTALSDQGLAQYGLPARPREAQQLTAWESIVRHARHRSCSTSPATGPAFSSLNQRTVCSAAPGSTCVTPSWAGVTARYHHFYAAQAQWTLGCLPYPFSSTSAAWVGPGDNEGTLPLVQAGVGTSVVPGWLPGIWIAKYEVRIEVYTHSSPPSPLDVNFPSGVHCGDQIYVEVGSLFNQDFYFLENLTTSEYYSAQFPGYWWPAIDTSLPEVEALWMVERPGSHLLQDFGTLSFTNAQATAFDGFVTYPAGSTSFYYDQMRNSSGYVLAAASTSPANNQRVNVTWYRPL